MEYSPAAAPRAPVVRIVQVQVQLPWIRRAQRRAVGAEYVGQPVAGGVAYVQRVGASQADLWAIAYRWSTMTMYGRIVLFEG